MRRDRDLSQTQAFELVYEALHLSPKSRASYIAIDMGDRQPEEAEAAVLAEEFGWPEETDEADQPADLAALVVALTALTAELREQNRLMRDEISAVREEALADGKAIGDQFQELGRRLKVLEMAQEARGPQPRPRGPSSRSRDAAPDVVAHPPTSYGAGR